MADSRDRAQTIFLNALEIAVEGERAAYVKAECGGEDGLRTEVEQLLDHAQRLGRFMDGGEETGKATRGQPLTEKPGAVIGRYKLLEEIGEGGMGVVYMAEQREPVRRKVALKIIKPGMDTREVIARFEAERQALAMMDHPDIAKVFDADATESGRPYFVMELVHGSPLTEYCEQIQLTTRERLELLAQVCLGVQHAHQKGIIHRDLKPSNVLVALYDGVPVPKIIDFGIAKAINQQPADAALTTACGLLIGTPMYMSPEQAGTGALDIDARSDIYSLGVMLYELLTGSTPFDPEVVHKAGYDEIRRMIREDEPQQPSARISTLRQAGTIASVAANRKTDPAKLSGLLRGDLDWIVMKALQKDRTRRYQTASDFARDIQHYLNDEPIEARPPTPFDRAAKWARRHRTIVWSAAASVFGGAAAILLGIVFLVSTGKGTVKLEFADAEAARQCTISIDGDDIRIENLGEPIKLRSGKHLLRIVQGDLEIETREFDVVRNGTQVLHVSIAARPGEYATTPSIQERASDYMRRASACADKGDFDKALAEASQAIRLNPWPDVWENCAAVYVAAGRLDEYRSTCAAILERHPQTEDPDTGALTALTCACGPDAVGDWSKVVAMAEMALKRDPKWPRYQRALGNILYRSGRFQEALQHLTEANRLNPEPSELWECSPAELWSFLAMAHYRLGHVEEAKKWLDKAAQWADKAFADERSGAGPRGVPVGRRLLIKCFRAEAEALIKGPAGQKAKTVPEGKEKTEQKPKAESGKRQ